MGVGIMGKWLCNMGLHKFTERTESWLAVYVLDNCARCGIEKGGK